MNLYKIEVEEILQKVCEISADTLEEAIDIAKEKYYIEEIVLEPECIKETNFREFNNLRNKDKKGKDKVR